MTYVFKGKQTQPIDSYYPGEIELRVSANDEYEARRFVSRLLNEAVYIFTLVTEKKRYDNLF